MELSLLLLSFRERETIFYSLCEKRSGCEYLQWNLKKKKRRFSHLLLSVRRIGWGWSVVGRDKQRGGARSINTLKASWISQVSLRSPIDPDSFIHIVSLCLSPSPTSSSCPCRLSFRCSALVRKPTGELFLFPFNFNAKVQNLCIPTF